MFAESPAFSGFSVDNLDAARSFYSDVLGLTVEDNAMGFLNLHLTTGGVILIYPKKDHVPAMYTVLNFPVTDISATVDELNGRGVVTKIYDDVTDERGIMWPPKPKFGPPICWFKDPAGNVLSVLAS